MQYFPKYSYTYLLWLLAVDCRHVELSLQLISTTILLSLARFRVYIRDNEIGDRRNEFTENEGGRRKEEGGRRRRKEKRRSRVRRGGGGKSFCVCSSSKYIRSSLRHDAAFLRETGETRNERYLDFREIPDPCVFRDSRKSRKIMRTVNLIEK